MAEYEWSDVTLEGVGCMVLLVIAYKIYRMRVSTSSNCCDGAVMVESENPGNETPRALRAILGSGETEAEVADRRMRELTTLARLKASHQLENKYSNYAHDPEIGISLEAVQAYLHERKLTDPPSFEQLEEAKDQVSTVSRVEPRAGRSRSRESH